MTTPGVEAVVFDAYGTLLDVHAATAAHSARLPPDWPRISADWRAKQLEYTWIQALTGTTHTDFWQLTQAALHHTAARHGITDPATLQLLLGTYRRCPPFPDAAPALQALRARGLRTAILSNGEPGMLSDAVGAAALAPLLDHTLSVEPAQTYKPHPTVYALAGQALALPPNRMAFVSSNPWDAQAAAHHGFRVFWCNRTAQPPEYGLDRTATAITTLAELSPALA